MRSKSNKTDLESQHSRLQTYTSILDKQIPHRKERDSLLLQEFESIQKWIKSFIRLPSNLNQRQAEISDTSLQFFRIHLSEMIKLNPKKVSNLKQKTKWYVQLTFSLFDPQKHTSINHSLVTQVFQVEPSNKKDFYVCQISKSFFFYTPDEVIIKVNAWFLESISLKRQQVIVGKEYMGSSTIYLKANRESTYLQAFFHLDEDERLGQGAQIIQYSKQDLLMSKEPDLPVLRYSIIKSDQLNILQKFIPKNCLCNSLDCIPGLASNRLPLDDEEIEITKSICSMKIKVEKLKIPVFMIRKGLAAAQLKVSNMYFKGISSMSTNIKEVRVIAHFHNGWTSVSVGTLLLKSDTEVKMTHSGISQAHFGKNSKKIKESTKQEDFKVFYSQKFANLSMLFNDEASILIICIEAKIECKFELTQYSGMQSSKSKKVEMLSWPLCFTLKTIPSISVDQSEEIQMTDGNFSELKDIHLFLKSYQEIYQQSKQKYQKKYAEQHPSDKVVCQLQFYIQNLQNQTLTISQNKEIVQKHQLASKTKLGEIQILLQQKEKLQRLKRKLKQEKRKKLIQLNQDVPFLDTISLKQEMYEQKIEQIKSQKEEQISIIKYLQDKLDQVNNANIEKQNQSLDESRSISDQPNRLEARIKKLPDHFISFIAEQNRVKEELNTRKYCWVNSFQPNYLKKSRQKGTNISQDTVNFIYSNKLSLKLTIHRIESYCEKLAEFFFYIQGFSNNISKTDFISINQQQKNIIFVDFDDAQQKVQEQLLFLQNSFLSVYSVSKESEKIKLTGLIDCQQILSSSMNNPKQGECFFFEGSRKFLKMSYELSLQRNDKKSQRNQSNLIEQKGKHEIKNKQFQILDRINRFKRNQKTQNKQAKAYQIINKIVSQKIIKLEPILYRRFTEQTRTVSVSNPTQELKCYQVVIIDRDLQYYDSVFENELIWIGDDNIAFQIQDKLGQTISLVKPNRQGIFKLNPNQSGQIVFSYISHRKCVSQSIRLDSIHMNVDHANQSPFSVYNHEHEISIHIKENETKIIAQIYQIKIIPMMEFSTLQICHFQQQPDVIVLPILHECLTLATDHKRQISATPRAIQIKSSNIKQNKVDVIQLSLKKILNQKQVIFQNICLTIWGCESIKVQGKLWQNVSILLPIQMSQIIKYQDECGYLIDLVTVYSGSSNLSIRNQNEKKYKMKYNLNKSSNNLYIKCDIDLNQIGEFTSKVEVTDHNEQCFYRFIINAKVAVPYPTETLLIKVPKEGNISHELFAYKNKLNIQKKYWIRTTHPYFLTALPIQIEIMGSQDHKFNLQFNFTRLREYLEQENKDEENIYIGMVSDTITDYFLFKCKNV